MATLDTHKAVENLIAAGFDKSQAEALVEVVSEESDEFVSQTGMRTDLQALELRLRAELAQRISRPTIQLAMLFVAALGVAVAILKWVPYAPIR